MSALSATVKADINANQSAAFEHIVPVDLASIFTGRATPSGVASAGRGPASLPASRFGSSPIRAFRPTLACMLTWR